MKYDIEITYKKIKYLRMKVRDGKVIISAPFFTSKLRINKFINDNTDFIEKSLLSQKEKKDNKVITFDTYIEVLNKKYYIMKTNTKSKVTDNYIFINENITDLRKEIKRLFKAEELKRFQLLTLHYYETMNMTKPLPEVKIKDVKSKWGSYNRKNNEILYASELIFKPSIVYDYIVVHELSHMIEFNHSSKFYDIVRCYCPCYKELKRILKED